MPSNHSILKLVQDRLYIPCYILYEHKSKVTRPQGSGTEAITLFYEMNVKNRLNSPPYFLTCLFTMSMGLSNVEHNPGNTQSAQCPNSASPNGQAYPFLAVGLSSNSTGNQYLWIQFVLSITQTSNLQDNFRLMVVCRCK